MKTQLSSQFIIQLVSDQTPKQNTVLKSRELLHIHSDGVPHLLEEVGDMVRGHVLVTVSLRIPGLNDGERVSTKFLEKPGGDASSAFLRDKNLSNDLL